MLKAGSKVGTQKRELEVRQVMGSWMRTHMHVGQRLCIFLVLDASACRPLPDSSLILCTYTFFCGYGSRHQVLP